MNNEKMELSRAVDAVVTVQARLSGSMLRNRSGHRSAWDKGVDLYAIELLELLWESLLGGWTSPDALADPAALRAAMLNGARDWSQYSWGGCAFAYNGDIAERLCTPSELKKKRGGELRPNSAEEWLDVQARALSQAAIRILRRMAQVLREMEG